MICGSICRETRIMSDSLDMSQRTSRSWCDDREAACCSPLGCREPDMTGAVGPTDSVSCGCGMRHFAAGASPEAGADRHPRGSSQRVGRGGCGEQGPCAGGRLG